jgi:ADP-ribose pyrophosphatase YjhB (NUDIX family)
MILGVNVAIIEGDSILLTLREDFEVWCLPGGHVDEGEALADAARREIREEIGLEVELTRLVGLYSRVGWRDYHLAGFAGRVIGGSLTPDPREVLDARFFPFDALPEHLLLGQAHRIQDAISGATGIVKTEYFPTTDVLSPSRTDLYALRDQSGLSRREFYSRNIPLLSGDQIKVELPGCLDT